MTTLHIPLQCRLLAYHSRSSCFHGGYHLSVSLYFPSITHSSASCDLDRPSSRYKEGTPVISDREAADSQAQTV